MHVSTWAWVGFAAFVTAALALDLYKHRSAHTVEFGEALRWSAFYLALGFGFAGFMWIGYGGTAAAQYTSAYLLEKSLAVDNLFVFALIFSYFKVPREYQHRVLFLGVLGALVFRALFLGAGVAIVSAFEWIFFVFGAFLVWTAIKLARGGEDPDMDPGKSVAVRLLRRVMPVSDEYSGQKLTVRKAGIRYATPLLAVVVAIEAADLIFAVDSVPAVLAVSDDLFIVYTSNALAILGLRALYFCLSGLLTKFHLLNKGLAIVLGFIGVKMLLQAAEHYAHGVPTIPIWASLLVIVAVLAGAIIGSLLFPAPPEEADATSAPEDGPKVTPNFSESEGTLPDSDALMRQGLADDVSAGGREPATPSGHGR
jgi:tellurite resistance protein TerC